MVGFGGVALHFGSVVANFGGVDVGGGDDVGGDNGVGGHDALLPRLGRWRVHVRRCNGGPVVEERREPKDVVHHHGRHDRIRFARQQVLVAGNQSVIDARQSADAGRPNDHLLRGRQLHRGEHDGEGDDGSGGETAARDLREQEQKTF